MSDRDYWRDRMDSWRRVETGVDSVTRQKVFEITSILDEEPCDLIYRPRKSAQQTPGGTLYTTTKEPICKVWPPDVTDEDGVVIQKGELKVPDEDDQIKINGEGFRVIDVEKYFDGGTGDFRGARLLLRTAETVSQGQ